MMKRHVERATSMTILLALGILLINKGKSLFVYATNVQESVGEHCSEHGQLMLRDNLL